MARSDNTADGRLEAEPEGTRSCRPHAASLRLHDPSASGSRSPSLLACSQHAQRRGLASLPNRLGSRKTNTTITPASGIGGTTAQSFQYNGLSQTTFARDTANGNNADVTIVYDSYDSMNRLLDYQRGVLATGGGSVTTPIALPGTDQSRSYNLDALGNWRATGFMPVGGSQTTDQRNHNKLNEIIQRTVGTSPAVTFQYDGLPGSSNGNLSNDGTLSYSYDSLNRPIQIKRVSDGLVVAAYVFDVLNRRARKAITNGGLTGNLPNGTTDYIYMGNQVMEERNPFGGTGSTDTPIRQYVWGTYPGAAALTRPLASTGFRQQNTGLGSLNIDECIQLTTLVPLGPQNLSPGTYYLLKDLLYRTVALTNATGGIVETYDTDAYGNTLIFTGPGADGIWFTDDDVQSSYGANEIIFCGYRFDPETELYYVRARTYNPTLGRWIQRDPIGYAGGINLYEYVGGRADAALDPLGLAAETGSNGTAPPNPWSPPPGGWRLWPIPPGPAGGPATPPNFPPAPADSPVCNKYPCSYTYVGANARCFCKCAGNSPWSQYVRACLANLYKFGASATLAHLSCYFWATEKFGVAAMPAATLAKCFGRCGGKLPGMPPPGPQLWPWPPTAF